MISFYEPCESIHCLAVHKGHVLQVNSSQRGLMLIPTRGNPTVTAAGYAARMFKFKCQVHHFKVAARDFAHHAWHGNHPQWVVNEVVVKRDLPIGMWQKTSKVTQQYDAEAQRALESFQAQWKVRSYDISTHGYKQPALEKAVPHIDSNAVSTALDLRPEILDVVAQLSVEIVKSPLPLDMLV